MLEVPILRQCQAHQKRYDGNQGLDHFTCRDVKSSFGLVTSKTNEMRGMMTASPFEGHKCLPRIGAAETTRDRENTKEM